MQVSLHYGNRSPHFHPEVFQVSRKRRADIRDAQLRLNALTKSISSPHATCSPLERKCVHVGERKCHRFRGGACARVCGERSASDTQNVRCTFADSYYVAAACITCRALRSHVTAVNDDCDREYYAADSSLCAEEKIKNDSKKLNK